MQNLPRRNEGRFARSLIARLRFCFGFATDTAISARPSWLLRSRTRRRRCRGPAPARRPSRLVQRYLRLRGVTLPASKGKLGSYLEDQLTDPARLDSLAWRREKVDQMRASL